MNWATTRRLSSIVAALVGPEVKHGRCRAWWRGGDNPTSVSIDEEKGCWYDHGRGNGGGILDLIQTVLGCDRRDARKWLDQRRGFSLNDRRPLTREEKRAYAQRRAYAEREADDLTAFREEALRLLRDEKNILFVSENAVSSAARTLIENPGRCTAFGSRHCFIYLPIKIVLLVTKVAPNQ